MRVKAPEKFVKIGGRSIKPLNMVCNFMNLSTETLTRFTSALSLTTFGPAFLFQRFPYMKAPMKTCLMIHLKILFKI